MVILKLLVILSGVIALFYAMILARQVLKEKEGNELMQYLSRSIEKGAMTFLRREYSILIIFVIVVALFILWVRGYVTAISFITGAVCSALAGLIGMKVATKANTRTTFAAQEFGLSRALKIAFSGGAVMGLSVSGFGLVGLGILYYFYDDPNLINGFALGASSIALFARVGGGIYTKAADVGADLVGKVEAGIPEDDPRNPATIADNVGDNVGDVAGMGADLFGSYVATVLAAMVLGNYVIRDMGGNITATDNFGGLGPILLPMLLAGLGIIFSILGSFLVKVKNDQAREQEVQSALNLGNWSSIALTAVASYFLIQWMLPETMTMKFFGKGDVSVSPNEVFYAVLIGLFVGGAISWLTELFTGLGKGPVLDIVSSFG